MLRIIAELGGSASDYGRSDQSGKAASDRAKPLERFRRQFVGAVTRRLSASGDGA